MAIDPASLPDWPKLMSLELAAAYFSISPNHFRALCITPIEIGRRVLYDRESLDLYAARQRGEAITGDQRARAASDVERDFLARRQRG